MKKCVVLCLSCYVCVCGVVRLIMEMEYGPSRESVSNISLLFLFFELNFYKWVSLSNSTQVVCCSTFSCHLFLSKRYMCDVFMYLLQ